MLVGRIAGVTVFGFLTLLVAITQHMLPQPVQKLEKGSLAPHFSVYDLDGGRLDSDELRGKVVVLNFWYISCPPCRIEIPKLNGLVERFSGRDVVFIAFAPDSADELRAFLEANEFKYRIVADATPVAVKYKVSGAPTHILLDRNLRVDTVRFGAITEREGELARLIEKLL